MSRVNPLESPGCSLQEELVVVYLHLDKFMLVKQCHVEHPPVITIFIGCINDSQMGGSLLFYPHYNHSPS